MKVRVTADHIARGHKGSCVSCPIALAINDRFNPYPTALVTSYSIDFSYYDEEQDIIHKANFKTPLRLKRFIYDFDHDLPVEPFEFVIRA